MTNFLDSQPLQVAQDIDFFERIGKNAEAEPEFVFIRNVGTRKRLESTGLRILVRCSGTPQEVLCGRAPALTPLVAADSPQGLGIQPDGGLADSPGGTGGEVQTHEHLLDDVPGAFVVAEKPVRKVDQPVLVSGHKNIEGIIAACTTLLEKGFVGLSGKGI